MLVLGRKEGEALLINGVRVVVTRIKGKQVAIGVEAPPEVKILREELAPRDPEPVGV